jgi:hypothetical protein
MIVGTNKFFKVGDLRYSLEKEILDDLDELIVHKVIYQISEFHLFEEYIQDMVDLIDDSVRLRRKNYDRHTEVDRLYIER